jgi:hypothetical protein
MTDDLDKLVSDRVAGGSMTPDDAAVVLKFREFLRIAGPVALWRSECGPTPAQRVAHNAMLADPEWRAFLLGENA